MILVALGSGSWVVGPGETLRSTPRQHTIRFAREQSFSLDHCLDARIIPHHRDVRATFGEVSMHVAETDDAIDVRGEGGARDAPDVFVEGEEIGRASCRERV